MAAAVITCSKCKQIFTSSSVFDDHYFAFHILNQKDNLVKNQPEEEKDEDEEMDDEEILNSEGEGDEDGEEDDEEMLSCQICNNQYNAEYKLNNHMLLRHNNYEDQLKLTDKVTYGFPGFEPLTNLGMLTSINRYTYDKLKEKKDPNFISDSCIICSSTFFELNTPLNRHHMPYQLLCCKNVVCSICIYNTYLYSGKTSCMFCQKNFENNNYISPARKILKKKQKLENASQKSNYVSVVSSSNKINKERWAEWRKKHTL